MDNNFEDIEKSLNERSDLMTVEDLIITELSRLTSDMDSTINIINSYTFKNEQNPDDQRLKSKQILSTSIKLLMEQINTMNTLGKRLATEMEEITDNG